MKYVNSRLSDAKAIIINKENGKLYSLFEFQKVDIYPEVSRFLITYNVTK